MAQLVKTAGMSINIIHTLKQWEGFLGRQAFSALPTAQKCINPSYDTVFVLNARSQCRCVYCAKLHLQMVFQKLVLL